jgi:Gamma tubulin complex component C-terminal
MRLSVGFGRLHRPSTSTYDLPKFDAVASNKGALPDSSIIKDYKHPCFVPRDLQSSLRNAQRSLAILQAACFNHPLLTEDVQNLSSLGWFWTAQEVTAAWDRKVIKSQADIIPFSSPLVLDGPEYKPELAHFQVFDRDPGVHLTNASPLNQIQKFIQTFPDSLPALTPTLDILTCLVLSPLSERAAALSTALLEVFMSPAISESLDHEVDLNLRSHLILLRSFLLLCSHSFKTKLSAALFSDSDQYLRETRWKDARSLLVTQRPPMGFEEQKPWPVGLALGLITRESWPPGGSELSFYLRTVIVDSIEAQANRKRMPSESGTNRPPTALDMAESNLGFAIRDLPTGKGRDRWLDPCCT